MRKNKDNAAICTATFGKILVFYVQLAPI